MHRLATPVILVLLLTGCSRDSDSGDRSDHTSSTTEGARLSADMATLDVLDADPQFWTFLELAERAGAAEKVDGDAITIIAPSSTAFARMNPSDLEALETDKALASALVQRHLLDQRLSFDTLRSLSEIETVSGINLPVVTDDDSVTVGGATVTKHDIETRNGVIHVIDAVIAPPDP